MSTKIKDETVVGDYCRIARHVMGSVTISVLHASRNDYIAMADVSTADFLAAVETECEVRIVPADAIVIERAELPEIVRDENGEFDALNRATWADGRRSATPATDNYTPEGCRRSATHYLALAEYLDAHPPVPPVDEAQVGALWSALAQWGVQIVGGASLDAVARKLVVEGWSK